MCGIGSQCFELGPPPDTILSMPPPPLPSFLVPRSSIIALASNDTQPCFAAFMCDVNSPGPREQSGIEFIELPGNSFDDVWLFIIVASLVGVILLVTVLTFILTKCREENTQKQPPMNGICGEPHISDDKSQTFMPGDILYPCPSNEQALQQQLVRENRMLWAALTPHGTRHFVSTTEPFPNYDDHYEVIDYHGNKPTKARDLTLKKTPIKSFDNSGFTDFDYEEMNILNATDYNHDDHDSGYQEPQEVIGTLNRNSPRPLVSTPTRIEHPNIPPLNMHPHRGHNNGTLTLNKKSTLTRRTSDTLNVYGTANI